MRCVLLVYTSLLLTGRHIAVVTAAQHHKPFLIKHFRAASQQSAQQLELSLTQSIAYSAVRHTHTWLQSLGV
jgi:hypothetical protein